MKEASFLVWSQSKYHDGNRNTADSVTEISLAWEGAWSAKTIALAIDTLGSFGIPQECYENYWYGSRCLASGHGVMVRYPSGRVRTFKA